MFGALQGIKVVDLTRLLPGPYCSMILADHGARVISIEDKKFKQDNLFIQDVYRNKEHICLNLKSEQGLEIFWKLVSEADVLLEGFRPGVVQKLGVDYESVCNVKPDIIYCSITGYGQYGGYEHRAGHDINYLSLSGVLELNGEKGRGPVVPGVQLADLVGGGLSAALGISMALLYRERTGQGQYIDISMTDGVLGLFPLVLYFRNLSKMEPERGNTLLSHRYACYNVYETADGRFISVGALERRFWKNLCTHLGREDLIERQFEEEKKEEIIAELASIFKNKTLAEWEEDLKNVDACCEPVRNLKEVLKHPLFQAREMVLSKDKAGGKEEPIIGVPIKMSNTPGQVNRTEVEFGQDTRKILKEIGYTEKEIGEMEKEGVF